MGKTLFEQNGGTYSQQGDYLLPDIKPPEQPEYEIGVWGNRRRQYLREHHRVLYYTMLTQCTLYPHLADVEQRAQTLCYQIEDALARQEGVTEELKSADMMTWVRKMNNIRNRAEELVKAELIYI